MSSLQIEAEITKNLPQITDCSINDKSNIKKLKRRFAVKVGAENRVFVAYPSEVWLTAEW